MTGRTQQARLHALAEELTERDQAVVREVVRLRFLSAGQIERLHFASLDIGASRERVRQRRLTSLTKHGLLLRLPRPIGGVRAGSRGYVYAPTGEAKRLVAFWAGAGIPNVRSAEVPGFGFVAHTVATAEVFVRLVEAQRANGLDVLEHQAEPACWRRYSGLMGGLQYLRPDAFAAIGVKDLEYRSLVEVDRGTEGSAALRRKLTSYVGYWRSGHEQQAHGVFPRVVWLMSSPPRLRLLRSLVSELPTGAQPLFSVALFDDAVDALRGGAL